MDEVKEGFTSYQKRLFLFLSVATFFEGYDFMALTQILPNLRQDMGLPPEASGYLVAVINLGTIIAFWLVRKADTWGRKRVLTVTIVGYTIFTFLSGMAPNVYVFAIVQLIARIFLLGEWAISMVIAAEEFPAKRRGMVLGVIQACASLGSIFCAGVVPLLLGTQYGWRLVYWVAIIPLLILGFLRRGMRETQRFAESDDSEVMPLMAIWKTPHAKTVLMLAAIWFVAYIPAQNAISFWKEFATAERGLTDGEVGLSIAIAAVAAMPFVFVSGKLLDVVGRKRGAYIIFAIGTFGIIGCYTFHGRWPLTAALVLGIFSASAYLPVLNSYTTELFPTRLRGSAYSWSNNLLGRLGYVASPALVGALVHQVGAYGPVVASTAVFNIIAAIMVWKMLPETAGLELETAAALATTQES